MHDVIRIILLIKENTQNLVESQDIFWCQGVKQTHIYSEYTKEQINLTSIIYSLVQYLEPFFYFFKYVDLSSFYRTSNKVHAIFFCETQTFSYKSSNFVKNKLVRENLKKRVRDIDMVCVPNFKALWWSNMFLQCFSQRRVL